MEIIPHANTKGKILRLHVKSHDGLESEQRGNDKADKIEKLIHQAENLEPLPYFIVAEEKFLAFHKHSSQTTFAHGSRNKN